VNSSPPSKPITIYIDADADACLVKQEIYRVAERHALAGAIVITADVPLASRAVKAGAEVIAPNGRAFTADSIGITLATRNLIDSLRRAVKIWTRSPIAPSAPLSRIRIIRHAAGRLSAGRRRRIAG
jgi:uncharacterized protein YaiI (UPF0178 family)